MKVIRTPIIITLGNTLLATVTQRFLEKMLEGNQPRGIHKAVKDEMFESLGVLFPAPWGVIWSNEQIHS